MREDFLAKGTKASTFLAPPDAIMLSQVATKNPLRRLPPESSSTLSTLRRTSMSMSHTFSTRFPRHATAVTVALRESLTTNRTVQHDRITKAAFMKYFDEELAARIEMRDIASVQERIKRVHCDSEYELGEVC